MTCLGLGDLGGFPFDGFCGFGLLLLRMKSKLDVLIFDTKSAFFKCKQNIVTSALLKIKLR